MNLDFDYQKTINNLEKRFNFEKKEDSEFDFFKIDRSLKLMDLLGYPNKSNALTIHIAGTNGKGSVSSLLSSILSLKYKVGLYSSPHLYQYTERIKINNKDISKKNFAKIYNFIEKRILEYEKISGKTFSFFEVLTAMSFIYFKKNKVDINVIETGIGGTYDTTNVVKSDIQVIRLPIAILFILFSQHSFKSSNFPIPPSKIIGTRAFASIFFEYSISIPFLVPSIST